MKLDVELDRCLCIHSQSQLIDIVLQVLLYQRKIIPEPVQYLLEVQDQKSQSFRTTYEQIKEALRGTFRSANTGLIREIVFLFGSTPYLPKEVYRIPTMSCDKHTHADEAGCGDHCNSLSSREKRKIFSSIALNKTTSSLWSNNSLCANDKLFVFLNASDKISSDLESIEMDPSFELPIDGQQKSLRYITVETKSACSNEDLPEFNAQIEGICEETWFRILPYFTRI
ncbi:protein cmt-1 [Ditylenchus destructor]|nr:protein cmt-1 [Ditylenchus destructor]